MRLHRRHLTEGQRGMVAAKLENMKQGGDRKSDQTANLQFDTSRADAAQMLNFGGSENLIKPEIQTAQI